jgi:Xaa-Pro dipeptidase
MKRTPLDEINSRIDRLRKQMDRVKLDGVLIIQRVDLFYFSGTGQDAHLFVPLDGEPVLLVRKSLERALEDCPMPDVRSVRNLTEITEIVKSSARGLKTLGLELDVLPVNNFRIYERIFPGVQFSDASPLIKEVRSVKSEYELSIMREAARLNDDMFAHIPEILREGMSEVEFAGLLEAFYRKQGHQGFVRVRGFNSEVFYGHIMSGPNLAVPSCSVGPTGGPGLNPSMPQGPGLKRIDAGEPISVDYVGIIEGYMVDQARTFFLDRIPEKFLLIHEVALSIQDAIVSEIKPGAKAEDLYEVGYEIAVENGLSDYFGGFPQPVPFVGHGIGLELDEAPVIGKKSNHILQAGMTIAIEPKFVIPDEGLAGIENSFVVTETGVEKLTNFSDEIHLIR